MQWEQVKTGFFDQRPSINWPPHAAAAGRKTSGVVFLGIHFCSSTAKRAHRQPGHSLFAWDCDPGKPQKTKTATRKRPPSATRPRSPESPRPGQVEPRQALGVYPAPPTAGDPGNVKAWGKAPQREFRRGEGHVNDYRSVQYVDRKYGEGPTPKEEHTVLSWKTLREEPPDEALGAPEAREVAVLDAPRGVPINVLLEKVALEAGATFADLRKKLLGRAPEGTTLFSVETEQFVLPDLEASKVVATDRVWLARDFWRSDADYDNARKHAP